MKVKITKCSHDGYWYHDRVGDVFNVISDSTCHYENYRVVDELKLGEIHYIKKIDCCVVEEEPDQQLAEFYETVCDYLNGITFSLKEKINIEQSHLDSLEKEKSSKVNYENENVAFIKGKITAYNKALSDVEFSKEMIKGEFYHN